MNRLLTSLLICVFSLSYAFAGSKSGIVLKSGDASAFLESSNARLTFDYGDVTVDSWSLSEMYADKGKGYKEKWEGWIKTSEKLFLSDFAKHSKGIKFVKSKKVAVPYFVVIKVSAIETGNTARGIFKPVLSLKAVKTGGAKMRGSITLKDKTGKVLTVLSIKDVTGVSGLNVSSRLSVLYMELSKQLRKFMSKAEKESVKESADEEETVEADEEDDDTDEEAEESDDDEGEEDDD